MNPAAETDPMDWLRANAPAQGEDDSAMGWLRSNAPAGKKWQASPRVTEDDVRRAMLNRSITPSPLGLGPDVVMGARQVVDAGAQMLTRGLESGANAFATRGYLPQGAAQFMAGQRQNVEGINQQALDEYSRNFAPDASPGSGIARVAGQALATMPMLPMRAAAGIAGAAAQGAGIGAATSALTPIYNAGDDFWRQKLGQAGQGAKLGAITGGGLGMAGRIISPNTSTEVKALMQEGVTPTLGQTLGGLFKTAEEKATSLPILGDAIRYAQGKGLVDLNRAIYNRILAPLGQKYDGPVGQEGIAKVGDKLSQAYETTLARMGPSPLTNEFTRGVEQLRSMLSSRPDALKTFDAILDNEVWQRFTSANTMTPSAMKAADSAIGTAARDYMARGNADQAMAARALSELQRGLRQMAADANPQQAYALNAIDRGWAQLVQLENAGKSVKVARNEGIVSPPDFLRAIKAGDTSARDRVFSRGEMMNQDLAQAADKVLSSKYPDSGTTGRALFNVGITGLGAWLRPETIAGLGAASVPYLPGARQMVAALLARRPQFAGLLGTPLKQAAPYVGMSAPLALPGPRPMGLLELAGMPNQAQ